MNIEDFDNELSSDDSDFCPEKHEQSLSENSGPEDEPVDSDDARDTNKSTKRKKTLKRRKVKTPIEEVKDDTAKEVDAEEEKRKADAIWADFLSSTESPLDLEPSKPATSSNASTTKANPPKPIIPTKAPAPKEIFEFAGEKIEIPSKSPTAENSTPSVAKPHTPGVKRTGGLSSVLNQLSKKNKLSVLEKTKLDWDGFKTNEGISEELQTHNRGRDG